MATTCVPDGASDANGNGMVLCRKQGEALAWDDRDLLPFLRNRNVPLGPGLVGCGSDATGPFVRLQVAVGYDPSGDVDAFVPPASPVRAALAYLMPRLAGIRATPPAQRTQGDRDLLALVALVRSDL